MSIKINANNFTQKLVIWVRVHHFQIRVQQYTNLQLLVRSLLKSVKRLGWVALERNGLEVTPSFRTLPSLNPWTELPRFYV